MFMKQLYLDTKAKIYRATSIMFLVQLFGALGAGFFFVIQNLFQTYHIFGLTAAENEPALWFLLFCMTDFFFIVLAVIVAYLIAGLPAVAPSFALSLYFAFFANPVADGESMYSFFFATPQNYGQSVSIGYMGYLIMAVALALLIKLLYAGWSRLKITIGRKLDNLFNKLRKKIKQIPADLQGLTVIEGVDLIVLILIIPVACAATVFMLVKYGIQVPFAALSQTLGNALNELASSNVILAAIVMGLMVGFDLIGPVSLAAFSVAVSAFLATGDAQLMTVYSVCFITVGWTAFFGIFCCKIFKKGKTDTDDMNFGTTGPINAFFENIKLTTAFAMPLACRSPFTVIPALMTGSAVGGLLTAAFGIVNTAYTDGSLPKYATGNYTYGSVDYTFAELFEQGEIYMSFTLPLRSGDWLSCRLPLFVIILVSAFIGGLVMMVLKEGEYRFLKKRDCCYEANGDIVLEMRAWGNQLAEKLKTNNE